MPILQEVYLLEGFGQSVVSDGLATLPNVHMLSAADIGSSVRADSRAPIENRQAEFTKTGRRLAAC